MLPIPKKLLAQGVRDMVRVSDARMSGTSYGACVLHVAPESFVGGPLALRPRRRHHRARRPRPAADAAGLGRGAGPPAGGVDARAQPHLPARLRPALLAARHPGRPGLRLRLPGGHRADSASRKSTRRCRQPDFFAGSTAARNSDTIRAPARRLRDATRLRGSARRFGSICRWSRQCARPDVSESHRNLEEATDVSQYGGERRRRVAWLGSPVGALRDRARRQRQRAGRHRHAARQRHRFERRRRSRRDGHRAAKPRPTSAGRRSPTRPATTFSPACRTAPTPSRPSSRASRRSCGERQASTSTRPSASI